MVPLANVALPTIVNEFLAVDASGPPVVGAEPGPCARTIVVERIRTRIRAPPANLQPRPAPSMNRWNHRPPILEGPVRRELSLAPMPASEPISFRTSENCKDSAGSKVAAAAENCRAFGGSVMRILPIVGREGATNPHCCNGLSQRPQMTAGRPPSVYRLLYVAA